MYEANIFIIVNLGCEMLYVIEQRLRAQNISLDKSIQVMNDITSMLLDPKFIDRLLIGNQQTKITIKPEHCKFILNDILCCSLMRLDEISMNKLWDLTTMISKWQLFISKLPQHLIDITFRHLDGVSKLHSHTKKTQLITYVKNKILDYWNMQSNKKQQDIYVSLKTWHDIFKVKVSILIRLGFQNLDGTFIKDINTIENDEDKHYMMELIMNIGNNIYDSSKEINNELNDVSDPDHRSSSSNSSIHHNKFNHLEDQLNIKLFTDNNDKHSTNKSLNDIIFTDLIDDVESESLSSKSNNNTDNDKQFVQLETNYRNTQSAEISWKNILDRENRGTSDLKSILNKKF